MAGVWSGIGYNKAVLCCAVSIGGIRGENWWQQHRMCKKRETKRGNERKKKKQEQKMRRDVCAQITSGKLLKRKMKIHRIAFASPIADICHQRIFHFHRFPFPLRRQIVLLQHNFDIIQSWFCVVHIVCVVRMCLCPLTAEPNNANANLFPCAMDWARAFQIHSIHNSLRECIAKQAIKSQQQMNYCLFASQFTSNAVAADQHNPNKQQTNQRHRPKNECTLPSSSSFTNQFAAKLHFYATKSHSPIDPFIVGCVMCLMVQRIIFIFECRYNALRVSFMIDF